MKKRIDKNRPTTFRGMITLGFLLSVIACQPTSVKTAQNPQRIVSLRPNLTELVFALGAGDRLVGVTDYCVWPDEAKDLPKIGSYLFPNLEKIMALAPDVILTNKESGTARSVDTLEKAGIPVVILETRRIEEIYATIEQLGELLEEKAAATALRQQIQRDLTQVQEMTQGQTPKKTLVVIQRRPLIIAGRASYFNEILEAAGGDNAAANLAVPYPQISMEEVMAWQPEVIIDIDPASSVRSWTEFSHLPAVEKGQVYLLSPDLFRPGPRIGQAAEKIAKALYE